MKDLLIVGAKEKRQGFLYVLLLFVIAGIVLISIVIYRNSGYLSGLSKEDGQHHSIPTIAEQQKKIAANFDSVVTNLDRAALDPDRYLFNNETIIHDMQRIHDGMLDARESDSTGIAYHCYLQMERFLVLYKEESDRQKNLDDNLKLYQGKQ